MKHIQTELNLGIAITSDNPHAPTKPQYDPYWDKLCWEEQSPCESVGEHVTPDTRKSAPQHDTGVNHWVERYWVQRGNTKYWYYRYMWMEGRKIRRKYIGSITSTKAKNKKQVIEEYIRGDYTPNEIITALSNFSTTAETH